MCIQQRSLTVAFSILSLLSIGACKDRNQKFDDDMRIENDPVEVRRASLQSSVNDAEIAGVVKVANEGEIEEANAALPRLRTTAARNLARGMLREHTASQNQLQQVLGAIAIQPQESSRTTDLKVASAANLNTLRSVDDQSVDRMYVDAQIQEHETLLKRLNEELIDQADDPKLAAFLRDLRTAVIMHLDHAKEAKADLIKNP